MYIQSGIIHIGDFKRWEGVGEVRAEKLPIEYKFSIQVMSTLKAQTSPQHNMQECSKSAFVPPKYIFLKIKKEK